MTETHLARPTTRIRAAVVDDEPDARQRLRTLLAEHGDIDVVAECRDGAEAARVLNALVTDGGVDLVFLDVQMPELDGFEVLAFLAAEHDEARLPAVVFVTAFDDYAIQAFDASAVDYLLKPYDRERFERALARGVARASATPAVTTAERDPASLRALLAQLRQLVGRSHARYARRFVARTGSKLVLVHAGDVDWIDVDGNYVRLHTRSGVHHLRDTLGAVEARLDPSVFVRVHRSVIVHLDRIASLEPYFHGEYVITMRDGTKVTASRSHAAQLRARLA
jgi:two-component system LytT family response regulator